MSGFTRRPNHSRNNDTTGTVASSVGWVGICGADLAEERAIYYIFLAQARPVQGIANTGGGGR